jgi:hypothetical protein
MALLGPLVIERVWMPMRLRPSCTLNVAKMTPMEPVTVVGSAKISSPASAT